MAAVFISQQHRGADRLLTNPRLEQNHADEGDLPTAVRAKPDPVQRDGVGAPVQTLQHGGGPGKGRCVMRCMRVWSLAGTSHVAPNFKHFLY